MAADIDPGRLVRALALTATRLDPATWCVTGGRQRHLVTVTADATTCDCRDADLRPDVVCKHRIAIHLGRLPESIREGLRNLIELRAFTPSKSKK